MQLKKNERKILAKSRTSNDVITVITIRDRKITHFSRELDRTIQANLPEKSWTFDMMIRCY